MISSIKICGINYDILYKSNEEMGGRSGYAHFNAQQICINTSHTPQTQKIALLHEVLHIMSDAYNPKMRLDEGFTTHALLALFTDNPDFISNIV